MNRPAFVAAFALALVGAIHASPEESPRAKSPILTTELNSRDLQFLLGAYDESVFIANLSDVAAKQAVTPEIKSVAARITNDQNALYDSLEKLAARKAVSVPEKVPFAKSFDTLVKLKGLKFDKYYLDTLNECLVRFQATVESGASSGDSDIKAAAQSALATVKLERDQIHKLGM
jgi:putative membrane protein